MSQSHSKRGNLFYATTTFPTPAGGTSASGDPGTGLKGLSVDPEWKSAYRLNLMKTWTCYCFDTEARLTRFTNTSKDDASVPSGGVIWGMRFGPASQPADFTDSLTNVSG